MQKLDIRIDWNAFVAGDASVFERVYQTFFNALYNYGCKYTADTELVEDAVQELFVRFWKNRANLTEPPSLKNYLFKAFRNHMNDRLKAAGRYVTDDFGDHGIFEWVPSAEEKQLEAEHEGIRKKQIEMAMESLTDRQREAIFLRFYEEFSYPEIAAMMGITVKATYKLMARSISTMREHFGGSSATVFWMFVGLRNKMK